jgi:hypothetical protein
MAASSIRRYAFRPETILPLGKPPTAAADHLPPVTGSVLVPSEVRVVGCNPARYVPLLAPVHTLAGASNHAPFGTPRGGT